MNAGEKPKTDEITSDLGDARRAIEFYEKAKEIAIEIGDKRDEGNCLGNLGSAYFTLGEYQRATSYYKEQRSDYARSVSPVARAKVTKGIVVAAFLV
jgi:tetratricopeptide (TPR) repeat protein